MKDVTRAEVRRGAYYDSIVLMQLQSALAAREGVLDAGAMMGTAANKEVLAGSGLLTEAAQAARPDDLIIVVRAANAEHAEAALGAVETLLARRAATSDEEYLPQSLAVAAKMMPEARWVLVSVPGRYAAGVAREALRLGKNVFLYSDNVAVEEEIALKQQAARAGLLVMGPDCGTAIVNGVGFGFANRVRRGPIGLIAASGTGLQAVSSRIHQLGGGISQALGTGGRDLSEAVGGITTRQALALLAADPATEVIVLISKPPAPQVAAEILELAQGAGKPVVVNFIGHVPASAQHGYPPLRAHLRSGSRTCGGACRARCNRCALRAVPFAPTQRFLRGLFSGGTLAYEALLLLSGDLAPIYSNVPLDKRYALPNPAESQGHTIVDLGEDEFTVGRLHPMMDNDLRLRRLRQEAADPEVALLLLDRGAGRRRARGPRQRARPRHRGGETGGGGGGTLFGGGRPAHRHGGGPAGAGAPTRAADGGGRARRAEQRGGAALRGRSAARAPAEAATLPPPDADLSLLHGSVSDDQCGGGAVCGERRGAGRDGAPGALAAPGRGQRAAGRAAGAHAQR